MIDLSLPQPRAALEAFLQEHAGSPITLRDLRPLPGGAGQASWELHWDDGKEEHHQVLRQDLGGHIVDSALSRAREHRLMSLAHGEGILVPRPSWLCEDASVLGAPFFLMDFIEGEAVGGRITRSEGLAEARKLLPRQMAEQLAKIHALPRDPPSELPAEVAGSAAKTAVEMAGRQLEQLGEPHPALELARRWLLLNAPQEEELVLCHGDFRIGNMLVDPTGLRAVLDWEFAHLGDPVEDLAWPCVRSWRFGREDLRMGGLCPREEWLDLYCRASGRDRRKLESRMTYWEILGNFRWAVACIQQARRHLDGQTQSLELLSLGRRTAEIESELLTLLESEMGT